MDGPKISVVIGSFNRRRLLELCIDAVRKELEGESQEIIVVDGGSTDGTVEWLTTQKDIISIIQHNRGEWKGRPITRKPWAYFMNLAFKAASGTYICLLSDDSLIVPGAIVNGVDLFDEMLAQGVKLGGVAFYFRDYPVRKQYAVAINVGNLYVNHGLYLNAAMKEVGYCDENYHFYFADTDLCLKLQAADYKVVPSKNSFVEHYFEATPELRASNNDGRKKIDRLHLVEKWAGIAFPEEEKDYYKKHVGRWERHKRVISDPNRTIQKLIAATRGGQFELGPRISVVTVVFQDPEGLERTIRSVLEQSYENVQFVVIDGGSKDATADVLERYGDRIDVVVSEPDKGIYDAMNKGISHIDGDYAVFMNAADTFTKPDTLEKVAPHLDGASDVVYGHRNYVRGSGTSVLQKSHPPEYVKQRMPYCHQSAFYRASVLREFPFNQTYRYAADYNQVAEIFARGGSFRQIDLTVCDYAEGGKSESGLRPYLEVLKIQFDQFGDGDHMASSEYMKGFLGNRDKLLGKYAAPVPPKDAAE